MAKKPETLDIELLSDTLIAGKVKKAKSKINVPYRVGVALIYTNKAKALASDTSTNTDPADDAGEGEKGK